jgi:hypothetical protein
LLGLRLVSMCEASYHTILAVVDMGARYVKQTLHLPDCKLLLLLASRIAPELSVANASNSISEYKLRSLLLWQVSFYARESRLCSSQSKVSSPAKYLASVIVTSHQWSRMVVILLVWRSTRALTSFF